MVALPLLVLVMLQQMLQYFLLLREVEEVVVALTQIQQEGLAVMVAHFQD
jgi:hypothetical protein